MLGHPLAVQSVTDLRADIDRAFDHAMAEVAALMVVPPQPPAPARAGPPPPPPGRPAASTGVPARPIPASPPPVERKLSVWDQLERDQGEIPPPVASDPISAFAPSPKMDWGPERPAIMSLGGLLRKHSGG
jgi:hypothetical protein